MKRFIKRVLIVLVVFAAVVDWPVETEGAGQVFKALSGMGRVARKSSGLFRSCSKATRQAEKYVNKASQWTERNVNRMLEESPNVQRSAAARGAMGASQAYGKSRQNQSLGICQTCHGCGYTLGRDGRQYICFQCHGTGRVGGSRR